MVKSPNQSGCDNVRFSRPSELEGQLKDFSTPLKLLETNDKAQLECVSATSSACTSAGYSKVSGLGNQTTQMNMSFIQVSPPSSSVNTVCQGSSKRSSRDKLSKVKTAMPLSTKPCTLIPTCKKSGEPLVLDCRSSLSSYPLRALKSVPLYSEHGFKSAPLTAFKKRLKDNQCETLKRIDIIEAEHSISPINFIPDEILCEIFSYVPLLELVKTCQKVCRRWHSVVRSPPLWRTLNFKGRETPIQIVEGLTRFLPGCLRSISIEDRYDIGFILPILHQQCKLLENVKLVHCRYLPSEIYLHAKHLYPILRKRQLRSLNLERTIYKSRKFYKSLSEMPNLEELIVSSSGITPQILTEIAYSSSLKVFKDKSNLSLYNPLRRNEWDSAYSLLFPILGPNLTTLEFNASFLKDLTLSSLAYCKNLKNLAVYSATSFGRKSMSAVSTLTGLQELLIHCAQNLTTSVVASAFSTGNMRGLKGLYLLNNDLKTSGECSVDDCVQIIASECQSLQHFSFTHSSSITDVGMDSVLSNCKQLLSLDFSDCNGISGQSFLSIPTSTPSLKLLVIERKCSVLKKAIVQSLANYGVKIQIGSTYEF